MHFSILAQTQQAQVQFLTSYIGHFFHDSKYISFWYDLVKSRLMTNMWYQFYVTWHDFLQQYVCDVKMTSKWLLKTNFCLRNQICLQQQYNMQKVYQVWDHFHLIKKFEYIYFKIHQVNIRIIYQWRCHWYFIVICQMYYHNDI